jgi:hypothetical protein
LDHFRRRTGESSNAQHSSSTVIDVCPVRPEARSDMARAITMLIAVSSMGSSFSFHRLV